jgi:hypothetical protein
LDNCSDFTCKRKGITQLSSNDLASQLTKPFNQLSTN